MNEFFTPCQCACECEFLADLPPLFGGVRALVPYLCPECKEAHYQTKCGACAGPPRGEIHYYRPSYLSYYKSAL